MATLDEVARRWDDAARDDARKWILTDERRDEEEFYATGDDALAPYLAGVEGRQRALDFGCGVGRLTCALRRAFFQRVDGVDASASMLAQARPMKGVNYHHNPRPHLALFARNSFDFAVSLLTLQHLPTDLQRAYVEDLLRVLKPGGVAVVQIPDGASSEHPDQPWLSMYGTPRADVESWLEGASDLQVLDDLDYAGSPMYSWTYRVVR